MLVTEFPTLVGYVIPYGDGGASLSLGSCSWLTLISGSTTMEIVCWLNAEVEAKLVYTVAGERPSSCPAEDRLPATAAVLRHCDDEHLTGTNSGSACEPICCGPDGTWRLRAPNAVRLAEDDPRAIDAVLQTEPSAASVASTSCFSWCTSSPRLLLWLCGTWSTSCLANRSIRQTSRRGIRRPCDPRRAGSRLQPHQQVMVVAVAVEQVHRCPSAHRLRG